MVSFSAYESDNRVMRYAEALAARGDSVDVVAVKKDERHPDEETIKGVHVHRVQQRSNKNQQRRGAYLFPLLKFWLRSSWWLARRQLKQPFDVIHVHNVPDFLVFAAWLPKLMGTKIVLDIHDIVPEFYASKFRSKSGEAEVNLLKKVEWASASFADHVIISNHLWHEKFVSRSAPAKKCSVFVNHVDSDIFRRHDRTRTDGKLIVLFPGGLQWHQGLDIAIRAFGKIAPSVPNAEFHIYGDGNMKERLIALTAELGLTARVKFFNPLPVREIVKVMANADLGVVPKRADSFGNEAYSTKIMEFMAVGVPVVISSTKIDKYYFTDDVVRFFESGNVDALADAMLDLIRDGEKRKTLVRNATAYVERNSWNTKRDEYLNLVDTLIARNGNRSH
jgi:glycosyltransferase involved in cell wall biosynthesis